MRRSWRFGAWMLLAAVASVPPACGEKKGGLMLAVTTDMKAPKDVSILSLTIKSGTQIKHNVLARVRPNGDVELPATIAIAEPDDPNETIRVRVIVFQEKKPRVLRDVRTTIPRGGRTALLRLGLNFVNDGSGTGDIPAELMPGAVGGSDAEFDPYSAVVSKCDLDMTVIDGECKNDYIDPETLPDFEESLVFGEGGKEACFQSGVCFSGAQPVTIQPGDTGSCSFPIGARSVTDLNLAFATKDTGECLADGRCLVPIDQGDAGWRVNGASIELSPGTCAKLREGATLVESHVASCKPKSAAQPLCEGGGTTPPTDGGPLPGDGGGGAEKIMPENFPTGVALVGPDLYMVSAQGLSVLKPGMPGQFLTGVSQRPGPRFITRAGTGIAIAEGPPKPATGPRGGGYVYTATGAQVERVDFPADVDAVNTVSFLGAPQATYVWGTSNSATGGLFGSPVSGIATPIFPPVMTNVMSAATISPVDFLLASDAGVLILCHFATGELMCDAPRVTASPVRIDALVVSPSLPQTALYLQADAVWRAALGGPSIVATKLAPNVAIAPFLSGGDHYPHGLVVVGPCAFFTTATSVEWVRVDGTAGARGVIASGGMGVPLGLDVGPSDGGKGYVYWANFGALNGGGGAYRAPFPLECTK